MDKQELIERIEDFPCEASLVTEMIRINKNTLLGWVKQLDEPQKVTVPQFVADWIEYCKKHNFTLFGCLDPVNGFERLADETFEGDVRKCIRWCRKESNILARAWLYGHTVEEEKRYRVKIKGKIEENLLVYGWGIKRYFFARAYNDSSKRGEHTHKELEEAGFGEVFNSPLFEVEEVEE